ncbi:MAG: transglycosylase SLT domain-containing protein [Pseudobdellovibrionaceae bacterium]
MFKRLLLVLFVSFSVQAQETGSDEETPVSHDQIAGEQSLTVARPWRAPIYNDQQGALGWSEEAFAVPAGLETQVKFWIDIYSKYTTDQGVLHDAENIDMIYEEIDFSPIVARTDLNVFQKERLKEKHLKEKRAYYTAILKKLHTVKSGEDLTGDEKRLWDYFQKVDEPKKFLEAAGKNRMRFQLGQRDRMIQGIFFSGRYLEEFEKIFREFGVPIELTRMVFVESSFNVLARSKVGASGLWQIMPSTMKMYHRKSDVVDMRNHPVAATRMAARVLRMNYNQLKAWPLAVTGYNHGPTGIQKLTKRYNTRDIGELVKNVQSRKSFGFASRNFYASFLAALEVERNAPRYLGNVTWSQTLDDVELKLPKAVQYSDLVRWFGGDDLRAQVFNPHITRLARRGKKSLPGGVIISVPKAQLSAIEKELESSESLKLARQTDVENQPQSSGSEKVKEYKVRRGDNLNRISAKFGVPVKEILAANNLESPNEIKSGQVLKIP